MRTELHDTRLESLCSIPRLKNFRIFIFDGKVTLQTDSRNMLLNKDPISSQVVRWKLLCEESSFQEEFLKGSDNFDADNLSRLNAIQTTNHLTTEVERRLKQKLLLK